MARFSLPHPKTQIFFNSFLCLHLRLVHIRFCIIASDLKRNNSHGWRVFSCCCLKGSHVNSAGTRWAVKVFNFTWSRWWMKAVNICPGLSSRLRPCSDLLSLAFLTCTLQVDVKAAPAIADIFLWIPLSWFSFLHLFKLSAVKPKLYLWTRRQMFPHLTLAVCGWWC